MTYPSQGVSALSGRNFLESALLRGGIRSRSFVLGWLDERRAVQRCEVTRIPLKSMKSWYFEDSTGNLVHRSGKFFKVEGIDARTNFGPTRRWMQPIINQPEVGILGFLTKKIDGVLHFLVQAKMEPGNINMVQLSPTVQATRSNYTQVHGGTRPRYLEYFLDRSQGRVVIDQLQSEQGSRFLRKRNRNMVVEIVEDEPIDVHEDFCWLTLGQLADLLQLNNIVNMDSRTVLSCIRYAGKRGDTWIGNCQVQGSEFHTAMLESVLAGEEMALHDFDTIISWITHLKTRFHLEVRPVALNKVEGWERTEWEVRHETGRFFSVIGVSVHASNREVNSWEQPLISSAKGGILCFICQKKKGVLHFLVQGRVEPGNFDLLEMAPTVQCTPRNYDLSKPELLPPFYDLIRDARPEQITYCSNQSEEGGRFYHDENRYLVIEVDSSMELKIPDNYLWMTLMQMKDFIRFNNYFNIEARGLISCLL